MVNLINLFRARVLNHSTGAMNLRDFELAIKIIESKSEKVTRKEIQLLQSLKNLKYKMATSSNRLIRFIYSKLHSYKVMQLNTILKKQNKYFRQMVMVELAANRTGAGKIKATILQPGGVATVNANGYEKNTMLPKVGAAKSSEICNMNPRYSLLEQDHDLSYREATLQLAHMQPTQDMVQELEQSQEPYIRLNSLINFRETLLKIRSDYQAKLMHANLSDEERAENLIRVRKIAGNSLSNLEQIHALILDESSKMKSFKKIREIGDVGYFLQSNLNSYLDILLNDEKRLMQEIIFLCSDHY